MLAGHSLGGSLSLLLALDILLNHTEEIPNKSDEKISPTGGRHKNKKNKKSEKNEKNGESDKFLSEEATYNVYENEETKREDRNSSKESIRSKELHCGSYTHHKGRRCTLTADPNMLDNLFVYTFGQPDLASSSFFKSVTLSSESAATLLRDR